MPPDKAKHRAQTVRNLRFGGTLAISYGSRQSPPIITTYIALEVWLKPLRAGSDSGREALPGMAPPLTRATVQPWPPSIANRSQSLMKIYGADNREMMDITALERDGRQLVIRGKIFGAMPLTAKLRPEEARAALKLLDLRTALFLLTLFFRRKSA